MAAVGLKCSCFSFEEEISNSEFQQRFDEINEDEDVDGILLLRPLPRHLDERAIEQRIDPAKDVDGISPVNLAKVFAGDPSGYAPCTPEAVIEMLDYAKIDLTGKRAVVVGRSLVVGKPLAMLLMGRNATVTVCHTKTVELPAVCRSAQVLVAAAGRARMLDGRYVGPDAVVVDVGINVDQSGPFAGMWTSGLCRSIPRSPLRCLAESELLLHRFWQSTWCRRLLGAGFLLKKRRSGSYDLQRLCAHKISGTFGA